MIDKKQATFTILFLLIIFLSLSLFTLRYEQTPIKWIAIAGFVIWVISEIGKYLSSGKESTVNYFRMISKAGMSIAAAGVALKGLIIIKQREVYVASGQVTGNDAVIQGIFLLFLAVVITIFVVKYMD
jgi:4-hydroxybenzoate polyprenyltransferase